jgi:uncharacterized protein YkwD
MARPPRTSWPNPWTILAILLGIGGLPAVVLHGNPMVGVIVLGAGFALALLGVGISLARRGADLGLAITAVAVCASGLFVALGWPVAKAAPTEAKPPAFAQGEPPSPTTPARPTHRVDPTGKAPPPAEKKPGREEVKDDPHRPWLKIDKEEPKKDLPPPEEPKKGAPTEEPKKEEPKKEAPKNEEPKKEELKKEPPREERPAGPEDPGLARALARINYHRKQAGLRPVTFHAGLSRPSQAHAAYLVRNLDNPTTRRLGPHTEDPSLPLYTPAGADAAHNSIINYYMTSADPAHYNPGDSQAVDSLMSTFFHRVPLIHPNLRHVGIGIAQEKQDRLYRWVTVIDIRDSRRRAGGRDWVVLYPGDGQTDVPTTFINTEHPSPTPPEGAGKKLGYCVTATFPHGVRVENAEATLSGPGDAALAAWVSTPSRPTPSAAFQGSTVCLIAKAPLRSSTSYTATLRAVVDGKEVGKSWTFTTGRE